MVVYLDINDVREIRRNLGLPYEMISEGTLSYILESVIDLFNNYNDNERYVRQHIFYII